MTPPDETLLRRWDDAAERGALRTSAACAQWRVAPGDLRVLVTFNPLHRANKRPIAEELSAPVAPATGKPVTTDFNFTKAKSNEFLCGLHASDAVPAELTVEQWDADSGEWPPPLHAVLINVSPLMRGHSLFVLDFQSLRPQVLTFEMLRLAAGVGYLLAREDFSLGFNSAGAWSSVNHCHFQGYWMNETPYHQFPVVQQPRELCFHATVGGSQVSVSHVPQWPARCFSIELGSAEPAGSARAVVEVIWRLIRLLQTQSIPHNLLFTWSPRPVAFVFPRQPQQENGVGRFSDDTQQLRFAIAEVAGLVVAGGEATFCEFTQDTYEDIMRHEISLDKVGAC